MFFHPSRSFLCFSLLLRSYCLDNECLCTRPVLPFSTIVPRLHGQVSNSPACAKSRSLTSPSNGRMIRAPNRGFRCHTTSRRSCRWGSIVFFLLLIDAVLSFSLPVVPTRCVMNFYLFYSCLISQRSFSGWVVKSVNRQLLPQVCVWRFDV